ncbi:MAG: EamA-like protein transporter family protein [Parcubacteria group bacterium GW2011_GWC2_38_7]|nr:MAG: EamA-like protein transporter family protein [Parcubacteria group bacterium GW2011_GWC2_38_7]
MNWIFLTLIAMVLWAVVNIIDKHVVSADLRDEISVTRIFGLIMSLCFIAIAFIFEPRVLSKAFSLSAFLGGFIYTIALWFYYYVMRREEVSRFVPAGGLEPIFASVAAFFLFQEQYEFINYFGMFLAIVGVMLISYKKHTRKIKSKHLIVFIVIAIFLFVVRNLLFKYSSVQGHDFWVTMFWAGIGSLFLPLIFTFLPHPRLRSRGWAGVKHLAVAAVLSSIALVCFTKAIIVGSVSLSSAVLATKPLLVFVLVLILSKFSPKIISESFTHKVLVQKAIAIVIIVAGGVLIVT